MSKLNDQLQTLAESLGASIDMDAANRGSGTIYADAPEGRQWRATTAHCIAAHYGDECGTRSAAIRFLMVEMKEGLYDCEPDCECRSPE